jgi:PTS system cellobiose-specific IIA component
MQFEEESAMQLILAAGDARTCSFEALKYAKQAKFEQAQSALKLAENHLTKAHKVHKSLIEAEAQGKLNHPSLLLMHAHAQVMSAITEKNLIEEMVELYQRL